MEKSGRLILTEDEIEQVSRNVVPCRFLEEPWSLTLDELREIIELQNNQR